MREPSPVFLIVLPSHKTGPKTRLMWKCLALVRRIILKDNSIAQIMDNAWRDDVGKNHRHGPINNFKLILEALGWEKLPNSWTFTRESDTDFDFLAPSLSLWGHEVRRSLKFALSTKIYKRMDIGGICRSHIFYDATTATLRHNNTGP